MSIITEANYKANIFLGLDYVTFAMTRNDFKGFIVFVLLYIVHMIFVGTIVLSIVNMIGIIQIISGVLLWFIITFIYWKLANKLIYKLTKRYNLSK